MRRVVLIVGLVACRAGFDPLLDARELDAGPDPSLVFHMPFDATDFLVDTIGGRIGTCMGCPTPGPDRNTGVAATFTGTGCIHVADDPALRPGVLTVAAWVAASDAGRQQEILSRPRDGETSNQNVYRLWVESTNEWRFEVGATMTGPAQVPDTWHHIAGVYDGIGAVLYIDGVEVIRRGLSLPAYAFDVLAIGCDRDVGVDDYVMIGSIDDVRLYNRALSAAEVMTLARL